MYYIIYALDRPDAGDLRIKTRAAHREYLHRPDLPVRLVLAGPLLADDAVTIIGSVIVVAADSRSRSEEHTSELQSLMRISYAVFCLTKNKKDIFQITLIKWFTL